MSATAAISAFVSALSLAPCPQLDDADIIGLAYDVDAVKNVLSRQTEGHNMGVLPRYCEYHRLLDDGARVLYREPDKELIAEKKLFYREQDRRRPEVEQVDYRFDELRMAKRSGNGWQVSYSGPGQAQQKNKRVGLNEIDIIDAGFDVAIREQWERLLAGGRANFSFLSVPHLRPITLTVVKQPVEQCIDTKETRSLVCFWVEPKSTFLRWLTSPLKLTYDSQSRRLMIFQGAVNILDKDRKTREAFIVYHYRDVAGG